MTIAVSLIIDKIHTYRARLYEILSRSETLKFKILHINLNYLKRLLGTSRSKCYQIIIWGDAGGINQALNVLIAVLCFVIAKLGNIKLIVWFGGWEWRERDHWRGVIGLIKRKVSLILFPFLLKCADAIITYGNFHKRFYRSLGVCAEKIFIAPNSSVIDTKLMDDVESIRRKIDIKDYEKVILYVGRLTKRKNVDTLIRAFYELRKTIKNVKLIIIGDGECKNSLQNLCKSLGLEKDVIFLGAIKREELPPYYMLCDVFVYPTSREPWGLAINEAMQFGKPVIATPRVAAAHDLIRNGINGYIVPERDPKALAEAIERIITDEKLAKKMGRYSKKIIRKFTYEAMAEGFKYAIKFALKRE